MQHVTSLADGEEFTTTSTRLVIRKGHKINAMTVLYLCTQQSLVRTVVTVTGILTRLIGERFPPCFAVS